MRLLPLSTGCINWRIPRAIGAAVLLLGIVGGTGYLVYSLSDDATKLIETLPAAVHKFRLASLKGSGNFRGRRWRACKKPPPNSNRRRARQALRHLLPHAG